MNKTITELKALLTKLECFCYDNNFPLFVTVHTEQDDDESYITRITSPAILGHADKKIADLTLIMNGFTAIPEDKPMDIHFESEDLTEDYKTDDTEHAIQE